MQKNTDVRMTLQKYFGMGEYQPTMLSGIVEMQNAVKIDLNEIYNLECDREKLLIEYSK